MHEWWRIKKLHICFQFPATIPETKSERSRWRAKLARNTLLPSYITPSAVLYNNIFFHRQRACLIAPFIREEARL